MTGVTTAAGRSGRETHTVNGKQIGVLLGAVLAAVMSSRAAAQAVTLHVAPDGDDKWTGKSAAPDAARTDGPKATLTGARDAVRTLRNGTPGRPVTVKVRPGAYLLSTPFVLEPQDSGTPTAPVVWECDPAGGAVFSAGRSVTGWKAETRDGRTVWTAEIPEAKGRPFRQLWVAGNRAVRARHPNGDDLLRIRELPDLDPKLPYNKNGARRFLYTAGDFPVPADFEGVEVVVNHLWVSVRLAVAAHDATKQLLEFRQTSRRRLAESHDVRKLAPYHVENAREFLDAPGEWWFDARAGVLHYVPRPGETPETARAVAGVAGSERLLRFQGDPAAGKFVEHVVLRGLAFRHAEATLPANEAGDLQASVAVPAAVEAVGMRNCLLERCTVGSVGGYAVHLQAGCRDNVLVGCLIEDTGAGGVRIGEIVRRPAGPLRTSGNTVTDCRILAGGRVHRQAVAVWIGQSSDNRLLHNEIVDHGYTGVSIGWTWGYAESLAGGNVVEANLIADIGKGDLSDMGGIYTLGGQPGTVLRRNLIRNIRARAYGGWGIYFDEGSTGILAEHNLVHDTTHGGFHQHYGRDNTVRGNVFAFGTNAQIRRTRQEPHLSFRFENNVVVWDRGTLLDGRWDDDGGRFRLAGNLYRPLGDAKPVFGKWSFDQWQARGQDSGATVADPRFADVGKRDFRTGQESPLAAMGVVVPTPDEVGPRPPYRAK